MHWKNGTNDAMSLSCRMDGRSMGRSTLKPWKEGTREGVRTGPEVRQSYQFATISVTGSCSLLIAHIVLDR